MKDTILIGDVIEQIKNISDCSINICITSPPYWGLRDYGEDEQIGLEETPEEYIEKMVQVFREVKRVLRDDGTLWLNLGDSYYNYRPGSVSQTKQSVANNDGAVVQNFAKRNKKQVGLKEKDLVGIPWRVAFALQADGWYLRQDIIWHKPNPMPESVKDRCTKAHEYIFLMSKSPKYYYDYEAIKEPCSPDNIIDFQNRKTFDNKGKGKAGSYDEARPDLTRSRDSYMPEDLKRNKRSVWTVTTKPFKGAHFATFPPELIEPCIIAGCPKDGIVLDPFFGAGTVGKVSLKNGRHYIGIELNPTYAEMANNRIEYNTVDEEEIEAAKLQGVLF